MVYGLIGSAEFIGVFRQVKSGVQYARLIANAHFLTINFSRFIQIL